MTEQEKAEQVAKADDVVSVASGDADANIFFPCGVPFSFGGRTYGIKPATLKQQKIILQLSKIDPNRLDAESIDLVISCIGQLIKEADKDFLEENLDAPTIAGLFRAISEANTLGIPQTGGNSGKGNGMRG